MLRIAVLDDYANVALTMADWSGIDAEVTVFDSPINDLPATLAEFDIVCLMRERTPFPADLINALPALKLIVTTGPRNLSIDTAAAKARGITVCGTRSRKTTTSELTLTLLLCLTRRIVPETQRLAKGEWQGMPGRDLAGQSLGIIGLGNIGKQVAALGQAFGMSVTAWSPNLTPERAAEAGVSFAPTPEELAAGSDVLTTHMVLSDRTKGLIGASVFAALPDDAIFLNTSRAGLVDRTALFEGMRQGKPHSAGIDVFEVEPLGPEDPWRAAMEEFGDRLLLTPHLGYVTEDTWRLFYQDTVEAIEHFLAGTPIREL